MKFEKLRLYKRGNGIWYVSFGRNKSRSLKTKDEREARRLFKAVKAEYLKGKLVQLDSGERISLSDFEAEFFERHSDLANETKRAYRLAFKLLSEFIGKTTLLSRIDEDVLDGFKGACLNRQVKKVSINTYLRHIRGILNKAYEWGYITKKVKVVMFRLPKRHPRILTDDERIRILKYAKKNDYEIYRIILFALWTGTRRDEIANLKWQNVNDDTCYIIGKGDKERTIPLMPKAWEAMRPQKDIGYVFQHYQDLSKYSKRFKKVARACGVEDIHLHNLRHTAATQMLKSGIAIEVVQKILGHESISTTQIYAEVVQELAKKEMMKMTY